MFFFVVSERMCRILVEKGDNREGSVFFLSNLTHNWCRLTCNMWRTAQCFGNVSPQFPLTSSLLAGAHFSVDLFAKRSDLTDQLPATAFGL